jgi:hypothetical protein
MGTRRQTMQQEQAHPALDQNRLAEREESCPSQMKKTGS